MNELLPCPHHEEAFYPERFSKHHITLFDFWSVRYDCPECGYSYYEMGVTEEQADEKARKGWNTRYEATCHFRQLPGPNKGVYECSNCGYCKDETKINYCPECGRRVAE